MEQEDQLTNLAPCTADLCPTCRTLGTTTPSSVITGFGRLDDIKARGRCPVCHVAYFAIRNHQLNRPREERDPTHDAFTLVPQDNGTFEGSQHGNGCICRLVVRVDSGSYPSSKPICTISHFRPGEEPRFDAEPGRDLSVADVSELRSWLQQCENEHDQCRVSYDLPPLLVIDVESMCLVEASSPRYFALSYVWGTAEVFKTLQSNVDDLRQAGALERLGETIPLLIRDAVLLVQRLGERYLWVDSLCIVQDDDKAKHSLIGRMDAIYAKAVCTIIAHGSADASCSLPGLREETRQPYRVTAQGGDGVFVSSSPHYSTCPSVYDTRGWTFQEQILSRRRLIFGADQVFFSCQSQTAGDRCENLPSSPADASTMYGPIQFMDQHGAAVGILPNLNPDLTGAGDLGRAKRAILELSRLDSGTGDGQQHQQLRWNALHAYTSAVTAYSSRRLSYPSDILNAFLGILLSLERSSGFTRKSSVYGLLPKYIRHNLHWFSQTGARRAGWPSWSWAGWDSEIFWVERENPQKLEYQIKDTFIFDRGRILKIPEDEIAVLAGTGDPGTQPDIPIDRQASLLALSNKSPIIAFKAAVADPDTLRVSPHPIRIRQIRIWTHSWEICGHMHEVYGYSTELVKNLLPRCRLVYLSRNSQPCVFHMYRGECAGSCYALVVDPGEDGQQNGFATRVGIAQICDNNWRVTPTHEEFVALV